jgi:uroporphyrin-3 C-methyltransferase
VNSDNPENENDLTAESGTEEPKPDLPRSTTAAGEEFESVVPDAGVNSAEPPAPPANGRRKSRGGGSLLAVFAFLFSLAALAGSAWMWWQDQASGGQEEERVFTEIARLESADSELSLKLNQIRDQLESRADEDLTAEFAALQRRLDVDRSQMESLEQNIREQIALSRSLQAATNSVQGRLRAAEAAVAGMSTRELDAGGELDLAEVDYLLRLANERLKLFSDPVAADQALEVADTHLAALDNPMYLGVRQDIAVARRDLAAVDMPDYLEIARELDAVQEAIPSLSFRGNESVSH